jgi:DNA-binding MarR family transcriptional regulator
MTVNGTRLSAEDLAHRLVELATRFNLAVPRRRRPGDLKEVEFLTLSILHGHDSLIVGDIQRRLGVLPAQMSRVIRSLEDRERPLIVCRINSHDKRKIDVALTPAGVRAFEDYQKARIQGVAALLGQLSDDDLEDLQRLLEKATERLSAAAT